MLQLLQVPLAVDQEYATGLNVLNDLEALGDVGGIVASNEVSLVDVVPWRRLEYSIPGSHTLPVVSTATTLRAL